jgi:hypothetical protein
VSGVTRRLTVALGVVAAGAVAAGVVLAFGGGGKGLTRTEYVARINAICARYAHRLDAIVPPDLAIPAAVDASVRSALPLVEQQAAEARAVDPPAGLKAQVDRFFALNERSIAALRDMRRAADRRDLGATARANDRFTEARDAAKGVSRRLGFRC